MHKETMMRETTQENLAKMYKEAVDANKGKSGASVLHFDEFAKKVNNEICLDKIFIGDWVDDKRFCTLIPLYGVDDSWLFRLNLEDVAEQDQIEACYAGAREVWDRVREEVYRSGFLMKIAYKKYLWYAT